MVSFTNRLCRFAASLLGKPLDVRNFEQQAISLCPAETQCVPAAIYLEEQLSRVTGTHHMSSIAEEHERLHQKVVHHGSAKLYPIGETKLFRAGLWTKRHEYVRRLLKPEDEIYCIKLENAVLTDSDIAQQYFGHWLSDAVPAALVGTAEMPSISFRKPHYKHAAQYADLFELNTIFGNSGEVKNLYLLLDHAQNSYKVKRYLNLRQRLKQKLQLTDEFAFEGVFMARGVTGVKRNLANEQQVIEHLQKRGFDIVYPENMTVTELVRRLWNAPLVISVEGSAFNHNIYSIALNGGYLILQPPHLFNHVHKGICDAMNRPYGFYVCHATQTQDEFYVDSLTNLDKIIDALKNETAKRQIVN